MNNERMIHTYNYYIPQFTLVSVSSYIANSLLSLNGNRENWRKPFEDDPLTATAIILKQQQ